MRRVAAEAISGHQAARGASTPTDRGDVRQEVLPVPADIIMTMQAIGDYAASEAMPAASAN